MGIDGHRRELLGTVQWAILDSNSGTEELDTATGYVDSIEPDSGNGAKTGAVCAPGRDAGRQLAWLTEVWSSLSEDARETMLGIARKAMRGRIAAESAADRTEASLS
ncbi:MAG: hypothetical protein HQ518_20390 [Rhodopirellula sp.]|nr:hypothetical protein [Rhodopirellula sp.]